MKHFRVKEGNKLPRLVVRVGVASGTGGSTAPLPLPYPLPTGPGGRQRRCLSHLGRRSGRWIGPSSLTCQMSFPGTILAPPRPPRTMPSTLGYRLSDGGRSALLLAEETEKNVRGRVEGQHRRDVPTEMAAEE